MIAKTFEVRDKGTFIPMVAIQLNPDTVADRYLIGRAGFNRQDRPFILFTALEGGPCKYDHVDWGNRTRSTAHKHIEENFDNLKSGAVIDVQFILGETELPKQSEMLI